MLLDYLKDETVFIPQTSIMKRNAQFFKKDLGNIIKQGKGGNQQKKLNLMKDELFEILSETINRYINVEFPKNSEEEQLDIK